MTRASAVLLAAAMVLAACSDGEPASVPTSQSTTSTCSDRADRMDVAYVDGGDPQQRLDLYQPPAAGCDAVPLVVWVHGGGWQAGDKGNGMEQKVRLWTDAGWAVASVNYRLTDVDLPVGERVMAPTHNEDVAGAIAWLITNHASLGIDTDRVALLGHSAGAGIAAAVASDPAYLGAHDLDTGMLACVAPLDTEGFDITAVAASGGRAGALYQQVFGTDSQQWADLSPISHLGEAAVPDLFLVRRGAPSRQGMVDAFAGAARDAGGTVTVVDLPGFSHADVNNRIGDAGDDVLTPALMELLEACLR